MDMGAGDGERGEGGHDGQTVSIGRAEDGSTEARRDDSISKGRSEREEKDERRERLLAD